MKLASTDRRAPTCGAMKPLRAKQTSSAVLPSRNAMAAPEALEVFRAWSASLANSCDSIVCAEFWTMPEDGVAMTFSNEGRFEVANEVGNHYTPLFEAQKTGPAKRLSECSAVTGRDSTERVAGESRHPVIDRDDLDVASWIIARKKGNGARI